MLTIFTCRNILLIIEILYFASFKTINSPHKKQTQIHRDHINYRSKPQIFIHIPHRTRKFKFKTSSKTLWNNKTETHTEKT